jgi:hypothetical protein
MPFNKLDESAAGKIRPRFKLQTPLDIDPMMDRIAHHCLEADDVHHRRLARVIRLSIPIEEQHVWSPVLHLSFDREGDYTIIRGLIGPSESVWQTVTVFYLSVSILGFFGSMYAFAEWQLNDNWGWLLVIPLTLIALSSIFAISFAGKKQAHTQMLHLLRFLRKAVDGVDCVRID